MRLLRSGEAASGETVPLGTLAALASDWYGDRLDPGLTGDFWRLG